MMYIIDTANLEGIKRVYDILPVDGVTTNPSILKKEGANPLEQLKKIRALLPAGAQLHVQTVSTVASEIIKEAMFILRQLGDNTYIKIPVFDEGIKAMKQLSTMGVNTTATAIYTPMQGFMAAKAGVKFVAPYVNRLDNIGFDGVEVAKNIHDILVRHSLDTKVLAASFKNTQQVLSLCEYGIGSITASPEVLEQLITHQITSLAIEEFNKDFAAVAGEGKTMMDLDD